MQHIDAQAKLLSLTELTADVSLTAEPFFARHGFHIIKRNRAICRGVILLNASMKKINLGIRMSLMEENNGRK
ncbi:putative acyltransferase [Moellerella wisconsensis]|nr:putative acyltransferase [Moellerella wisconsensis]